MKATGVLVLLACSWLPALLGGCADESGTGADAGADRALACDPTFGRTYVIDTMELLPEGEGDDLDGDGAPDNALGVAADFANPSFQDSLETGEGIFLLDVVDWTEPPTPDDSDLLLVFYQALDADVPQDPTNNLGGAGEFRALANQFDLACEPTSTFDEAVLADRFLTARAEQLSWVVPWIGTVEIIDLSIAATFNGNYTRMTWRMSGIGGVCSLSRGILPNTSGTLLDLIVGGFHINPDIDLDGDGLEELVDDNGSVVECIDGDGTVISGPGCPCDARMADGYSVAMRGTTARARIVGVVAN